MREAKHEKSSSWSISFSRLVWNDVCRQTQYAVDRRAVTALAKLPWWKGPGSISSGVNATNRAHTPKGVKKLPRYGKACADKMRSLLMTAADERGGRHQAHILRAGARPRVSPG